jgi:hypothetical protein
MRYAGDGVKRGRDGGPDQFANRAAHADARGGTWVTFRSRASARRVRFF